MASAGLLIDGTLARLVPGSVERFAAGSVLAGGALLLTR
jgi:hypothetical protein